MQAQIKRVEKHNKTFSFMTKGRSDLFTESPGGFSSKIPVNWIISQVEHSLNSNGFVSSVDCVGGH